MTINNQTMKLPIKGMHCRSCELLVEDNLKELPNIDSVQVNHSTGEATIGYSGDQPSQEALARAVKKAGYDVGQEGAKPLFNFSTDNLLEVIVAASILFLIFVVLRGLGFTDISINPDTAEAGLGLPLLVGLVAGVSTCMAIVGGLVLGLSAKFSQLHPQASRLASFRPHLFFVGGRILGYAALGGLLGLLGSVFQLSSVTNAALTVLVGGLMLFLGLQLTNLFPRLSAMSFSLPPSIARFFGINKQNGEYSHKHAAMLGALTFFLPCGFTQAMQVFAVSRGNFLEGAIIMGLFALGTAPGLLGIGGLAASVKGSFKKLFFKTVGVAVVALSVFNLNNGLTLLATSMAFAGETDNNQAAFDQNDPNVSLEDGVQVVRMAETNRGYVPNSFTIRKDMPVKWVIDGQAPYSCATALIVPELDIQTTLKAGENIIEFTPTKAGPLKFSCSMGMYTGVFNVVDAETGAKPAAAADRGDSQAVAAAGSGTCGGSGGCGCGGARKAPAKTDSEPVVAATEQDSATQEAVQVIKSTYTDAKYLEPAAFKVKAGVPVRFEIDVKDDGVGCGSAITIPELADSVEPLAAGTTITFEFTPADAGEFPITCGMNMMRFGSIIVE